MDAQTTNMLIREHTTCGGCGELRDVCIVRTLQNVHGELKQVELCEKCLYAMRVVIELHCRLCEHGVREADYCEDCNAAYKQAVIDNETF